MSLLTLLLPQTSGTFSWSVVAGASSIWTVSHYDIKNIWSEWVAFTWGQIAASNYSWAAMAGYTFTTTTGSTTSWTITTS